MTVMDTFLCLFASGTFAAILSFPLRFLYRQCWGLSTQRLVIVIGIASLVVAFLWTPAKNIVMWKFGEGYDVFAAIRGEYEEPFNPLFLFATYSYSFFMIVVWSSLYFGINYHYRLLQEKEQHIEAVRLSHNAQIKMLRYQINPHFLFNTLNAISTLVLKGSKERANGMLARLSTFLRYSLDNDPEKKIRLYEELKALMLYLEIEKTRFDERLSVRFNVEVKAESLLVPSLLLQPLVENSIKYAIAKMPSNGVIEITAKCINNLLHLEVTDNGPETAIIKSQSYDTERSQKKGSGVGLRNIYDRLNVLYEDKFNLVIKNNVPNGLKVIIEIPIEES